MTTMLRLRRVREPRGLVLVVEGALTAGTVPILEAECADCLGQNGTVFLDPCDVNYLDGAGVNLVRRLCKLGVEVARSSQVVRELIEG